MYQVEFVSFAKFEEAKLVKLKITISVIVSVGEQLSFANILVVKLLLATMQASNGKSPIIVGLVLQVEFIYLIQTKNCKGTDDKAVVDVFVAKSSIWKAAAYKPTTAVVAFI